MFRGFDIESTGRGIGQQNELLRMRYGQDSEHHRINQAEDRGIGSHAESKREHRNSGESRTLAQSARSIADVSKNRFQPGACTFLPDLLLHLLRTIKATAGLAARFFRGHAARSVLSRSDVEPGLNFFVEIPITLPAPEHD